MTNELLWERKFYKVKSYGFMLKVPSSFEVINGDNQNDKRRSG